jgi:protein-disulfide isomerase
LRSSRQWLSVGSLVVVGALFSNALCSAAEPLFSVGGKSVETKDLSPGQQQQLFEIQAESYERTKMAIDNILFENYLDEEAKKQSKSKDEIANKLMDVKAPSEKDVKKWYEENKAKIPPNYKFEEIKDKIAEIIKQEQMKTKREGALEKIKKEKKFSLSLAKPVSPVVELNVDGFPSKGKDKPKVTIVEFADFQCPHCRAAADALKKVVEKHKDQVRLTYVDFPINPSGISKIVAEGSHCAEEQGKYWDYHYKAFEGQQTLDKDSPSKLAKELKLDEAKFKACFDAGKGKSVVEKGRAEGERIGVSGTPYILMNGRRYMGAHSVEAFTSELATLLK